MCVHVCKCMCVRVHVCVRVSLYVHMYGTGNIILQDWLCKVQRIDPTHPLVFKLKVQTMHNELYYTYCLQEKLLTTTNTIDHCNGLKDIIGEQLVSTR